MCGQSITPTNPARGAWCAACEMTDPAAITPPGNEQEVDGLYAQALLIDGLYPPRPETGAIPGGALKGEK